MDSTACKGFRVCAKRAIYRRRSQRSSAKNRGQYQITPFNFSEILEIVNILSVSYEAWD